MDFRTLKDYWAEQGCFSLAELMAWDNKLVANNLSRWVAKGWLLRLRQGWYAFPEVKQRIDFYRVVADRIYNPSYISLQSALSIYGIIPECVVQNTCVTSLKTASFHNELGQYFYYHVKPELMFGYKPVSTPDGRTYYLAEPEKALLDFLYLNPFYNTLEELEELRCDDYFMTEELRLDRMEAYLARFANKALEKRTRQLLSLYTND